MNVLDERERASAWLSRRHPGSSLAVEASLAWTDAELATLFDVFSHERCTTLLARHGLRPLAH